MAQTVPRKPHPHYINSSGDAQHLHGVSKSSRTPRTPGEALELFAPRSLRTPETDIPEIKGWGKGAVIAWACQKSLRPRLRARKPTSDVCDVSNGRQAVYSHQQPRPGLRTRNSDSRAFEVFHAIESDLNGGKVVARLEHVSKVTRPPVAVPTIYEGNKRGPHPSPRSGSTTIPQAHQTSGILPSFPTNGVAANISYAHGDYRQQPMLHFNTHQIDLKLDKQCQPRNVFTSANSPLQEVRKDDQNNIIDAHTFSTNLSAVSAYERTRLAQLETMTPQTLIDVSSQTTDCIDVENPDYRPRGNSLGTETKRWMLSGDWSLLPDVRFVHPSKAAINRTISSGGVVKADIDSGLLDESHRDVVITRPSSTIVSSAPGVNIDRGQLDSMVGLKTWMRRAFAFVQPIIPGFGSMKASMSVMLRAIIVIYIVILLWQAVTTALRMLRVLGLPVKLLAQGLVWLCH